MKLNVIAQPEETAAGQNESGRARRTRMQDFWANPENALLHPVGPLLASTAPDGRTLARIVAGGESVEMETITVDGNMLPLASGTVLSLANIAEWGCPACRSAHGSRVYPSPAVSATNLAKNDFYYRPSNQRLFIISDTCWKNYVEDLGANTPARFTVTPHSFVTSNGLSISNSSEPLEAWELSDKGNADENSASLVDRTDVVESLNKRMETLNDSDLWSNLNYFYPMFHNLVSTVAKDVGMSIGYVQRVLDGERKSAEVQAAINREFRRRIQTNHDREDRSDEDVLKRILSAGQSGEHAQAKPQNVTVPNLCNDAVGFDPSGMQIDRKKADESSIDASKTFKLYRFARWLGRAFTKLARG